MKKPMDAVTEFHEAYGLGIENKPQANLPKNIVELRYHLMKEENEEYLQAAEENDLVEIGDALGDMLYILCGTIISHGFQDKMEAIFDEIQRSNMSKLGADGKPIYRADGKVLKGPNYFKPDLAKILASD
ncbi:MAG: nucleoside triphosphate pyrophosphohydrolase family protein [Flavobacteriaceae bacterium]|nr:nucleoside triphosphate pyrophosphohydrolase family protein [Flavobacteriaceae bacterium]MDG1911694.1 nucleoside triphosphate pyrophosphohydrolase family protein [Flavobacteriaceae bacterium]